MSSSSEETHDDDEQGRVPTLAVRQEQTTAKEMLTPSQESTDAGSVSSQQADGSIPKSRKRSLDEGVATDLPEDEQHSSQSAFRQCLSHTQQNSIQQAQTLPLASHSHALQLLLSAAHSHEGISRLNQSNEGASLAFSATQDASQHASQPRLERTDQPSLFARSSLPNSTWLSQVSSTRSAQLQPQEVPKQASSHIDMLYAPTRSTTRISAQLIWSIQRLERPEMDADSVQAALEFADAVRINPAQHAKQPGFPSQHVSEQATLLHTLEVGTGRLDVLRVLTHRVHSSSFSERGYGQNGPGQLLDVIQDLLKDMENSRQLLYHAQQTVLAYKQAALARVESLQFHSRAAQDYWLQTQRLRHVAAKRRTVLQKMMMLPEDCPGRELLELHEKLRETVVHALEVSACKVRLSSDMQSAQARLLAQGVSGVTTAGMINGSVELAVNRPVLRLQTLLRIIHGIDSTRGVLLAELASALAQSPWNQQHPHMPGDSHKLQLAEAVSQVQAGTEGLLQQGWRAAGPGQKGLAPIQSVLAGTPVASHSPSKAAKFGDAQSPRECIRSMESTLGGQSPDRASPRSALPLHASRGNCGLLSRESKSGISLRNAKEIPASDAAPLLHAPGQARLQSDVKEHIVIRPRASRPKAGFNQYESGRDPRAQHMVVKQARSVTPQPESEAQPALPRASAEQSQGRATTHVPSDSARANALPNLGTAQSPEVLAAAQALLQSHLQQLAVKPGQMSPQLLGLFHAVCTNPSDEQAPRASSQALDPDSDSPLHHAKSQTCKPAREDLSHDKVVLDSRCQAGKAPRLSRSDSGKGLQDNRSPPEGGSALEQAIRLNQVQLMKSNADSAKAYSTAAGQQDAQNQAAVYAQHLYGLLAAQAQAVNGAPGLQACTTGPKAANKKNGDTEGFTPTQFSIPGRCDKKLKPNSSTNKHRDSGEWVQRLLDLMARKSLF